MVALPLDSFEWLAVKGTPLRRRGMPKAVLAALPAVTRRTVALTTITLAVTNAVIGAVPPIDAAVVATPPPPTDTLALYTSATLWTTAVIRPARLARDDRTAQKKRQACSKSHMR